VLVCFVMVYIKTSWTPV